MALTGKVFNIEQDQAREAVQVWADPARQTGNTVVIFMKDGAPSIKKDDMVHAEGELDGEFTGKSDSGEVLHLPRVQATSISILGLNGASASASPSGTVAGATTSSAAVTASPTTAPGTLAKGIYRVANADPNGLNIRVGPALNQAKIGVVHDGGLIEVLSSTRGSAYVPVAGDGFTGYAALIYLKGPVDLPNPTLAKLTPK